MWEYLLGNTYRCPLGTMHSWRNDTDALRHNYLMSVTVPFSSCVIKGSSELR